MDIQDQLKIAVAHHRAGRLHEAEQQYQKILADNPDQPDGWHLLGLIALQVGRSDLALAHIRNAIGLNSQVALFHNSLGKVFESMGNKEDALSAFRHAIALDPNHQDALQSIIRIKPEWADAYFYLGNVLINKGLFNEAMINLEKTIHLKPVFPNAYHNLASLIVLMGGNMDLAEEHYKTAIQQQPDFVDAYQNLGVLLLKRKKTEDALQCFLQVLELSPGNAHAYAGLGDTYREMGHLDSAIENYTKAAEIAPDYPMAFYNLGKIFEEKKDFFSADSAYTRAISLDAHNSCFYRALGDLQLRQDRVEEAVTSYQNALKYASENNAELLNNMGVALERFNRRKEAMDYYRRAILLQPQYADAFYNLGTGLMNDGDYDGAIENFNQAIQYDATFLNAYNNLANTYKTIGNIASAIDMYQKAIEIDPECVAARVNLATTLLLKGDYAAGWEAYEWRLKRQDCILPHWRNTHIPEWDGRSFQNKCLLVIAEQGLGDTIQFSRYISMIKSKGGKIVFAVADALVPLLCSVEGIDQCISMNDPIDCNLFDLYIPLLSLPRIMGTDDSSIPAPIPYINAEMEKTDAWQSELNDSNFKVALVWAGNPRNHDDHNRSIPLTLFEGILHTQNIAFYGMQKEVPQQDVPYLEGYTRIKNYGDRVDDFSDTAGFIANMDLTITVDTAVVHLAGAMGKTVWLLRPYTKYWVWQLDRDDSPWYPTLRIFQQQEPKNWQSVLKRVENALHAIVA